MNTFLVLLLTTSRVPLLTTSTSRGRRCKVRAVKNHYSRTPNVTSSTQTTIDNFEVAKAHSSTEATTDLQKDLITAYNVGKKRRKSRTGMDSQFQHALSQIEFKAINPASTYDVYVAGVALYHIAGTGTLTFQSSSR